jgi:RNA polymerase sporulation-specific sigma factor
MEEKLILDNINLIYHVLKKYNLYSDLDEYFDIGMIGLVKAAKKFDGSKGYKPSTYLSNCIANEILCYIRNQKCLKRGSGIKNISIYTPITDEIDLLDCIRSNEDIEKNTIKKEQHELLYQEISKLNERDKFIICSKYGLLGYEELTQEQLSEATGLSQSYVCRIIKKFIEEVRRKYE